MREMSAVLDVKRTSVETIEGVGYTIQLPEAWAGKVTVRASGHDELRGFSVSARGWGIEGEEVASCYPVPKENVEFFVASARRLGSVTLGSGQKVGIYVWDETRVFFDVAMPNGRHLFAFALQVVVANACFGATMGRRQANALARMQTLGEMVYDDDPYGYGVPLACLRAIARRTSI
ncbi:MAG: hypothetical protein Q4A01_03080 [Coriobacteriales bacterium]|nr:hypothetical protein [Coriobacteriales bacterium]